MSTYYADQTLCRSAAIVISKHLWRHTELRDEIKLYVDQYQQSVSTHFSKTIARIVKGLGDKFFIPEPAKEELMFVVVEMGENMLWTLIEELRGLLCDEVLEEDIATHTINVSACLEYFSWRADGSANVSDIVRSAYFAGLFISNYAAWSALSYYCLEDCINDLWPEMGNIDEYRRYREGEDSDWEELWLLETYWIARMENNLHDVIDFFQRSPYEFYDDSSSIEENMFINSVADSHYSAVQYFWGLLDENQRIRTIPKIYGEFTSDHLYRRMDAFSLWDELQPYETVDSRVFFLHQLSHYGLNEMRIELLRSGLILCGFLYFLYDGYFLDTLREMSTDHNFIDFGPIFSDLFSIISECNKDLLIDKGVKYRRIFYSIWNANLPKLKSSIDYKEGLKRLWKSKDIELLYFILRDEELKDRREEFLKGLGEEIVHRDESRSSFYEDFLRKVLISNEERKWFCPHILSRRPMLDFNFFRHSSSDDSS